LIQDELGFTCKSNELELTVSHYKKFRAILKNLTITISERKSIFSAKFKTATSLISPARSLLQIPRYLLLTINIK